jgi:hypothetical protein
VISRRSADWPTFRILTFAPVFRRGSKSLTEDHPNLTNVAGPPCRAPLILSSSRLLRKDYTGFARSDIDFAIALRLSTRLKPQRRTTVDGAPVCPTHDLLDVSRVVERQSQAAKQAGIVARFTPDAPEWTFIRRALGSPESAYQGTTIPRCATRRSSRRAFLTEMNCDPTDDDVASSEAILRTRSIWLAFAWIIGVYPFDRSQLRQNVSTVSMIRRTSG